MPFITELSTDRRLLIVQILSLIIIFALTWILRKKIARVLLIPLRTLTKRTTTTTDDFFMKSLDKVLPYAILAIPLYASTLIFTLSDSLQTLAIGIATTLVAFAIFRLFYDLVARLLISPNRVSKVTGYELQPALMPVIRLSAKTLVITLGILTIAQIWSWNVAGIVAGVGLGGLAISLAAKDLLDDILGYMIIIGDNIFREDEYIVSPYGEGIVEQIGVRSTRVRQLNQGLVTIPNAKLSSDWVTNWARLEKRWFNFVVGITLGSTADKIQTFVTTLTEKLKAREHVQEDSVVVLFTEYDTSSLSVLVRSYVDLPDWVDAHAERHKVNLVIMQTLKDVGLEIAFPSRSLYLEDMPAGLAPQQTKQTASQNGNANGNHTKAAATQTSSGESAYPQGDDNAEVAEKAGESEAE